MLRNDKIAEYAGGIFRFLFVWIGSAVFKRSVFMNYQIKKLTTAAVVIALGVVCSAFYIPVGASKCFPVQHVVNVIAGVTLGPAYGFGMAFATSLIRVLLGTGSLLAFPGSMVGALLCGILYQYFGKKLYLAYIGEVFGTGILGALVAYPVATLIMGQEAAAFAYVVPFLVSTAGGATMAFVLLCALKRAKVLERVQVSLGTTKQ